MGSDGALQGAARYGLLNIPEPVAAADTDFNRAITLEEFSAGGDRPLPASRQQRTRARLTLAQLEAMRANAARRRATGPNSSRDALDPRIGNPIASPDTQVSAHEFI